jgi:PDZ domain
MFATRHTREVNFIWVLLIMDPYKSLTRFILRSTEGLIGQEKISMNSTLCVLITVLSFLILGIGSITMLAYFNPPSQSWASSYQGNVTSFNSTSDILPLFNNKTAEINSSQANYGPAGVLQEPYTGLVLDQITPESGNALGLNGSTFGMIVSDIRPNSPAEIAGLYSGNITRSVGGNILRLGGDIILAVDGNSSYVKSIDAYSNYFQNAKKVGENLTLTVFRNQELKDVNITIGAYPESFWYNNSDEGITIAYPSDWEVSEENLKKEDIVKFFSPEENPSNGLPSAGVFLKIVPAGEFGLDTLARQETEEATNIRNLHVKFSDLGGLPSYESVFYNYSDDNRTLKMLSAFTIKDGKQIYRINFAADPWKYEEYLPMARKMIDTFQFLSIS